MNGNKAEFSADNSYLLIDTTTLEGKRTTHNPLELKEYEGIKCAGKRVSKKSIFQFVCSFSPVDISELLNVGRPYIEANIYVSSDAGISEGQFELTSSGVSDRNELHWDDFGVGREFHIGWNTFKLYFSDAVVSGGANDCTAENYMRWYLYVANETDIAIGNCYIKTEPFEEIVPFDGEYNGIKFSQEEIYSVKKAPGYLRTLEVRMMLPADLDYSKPVGVFLGGYPLQKNNDFKLTTNGHPQFKLPSSCTVVTIPDVSVPRGIPVTLAFVFGDDNTISCYLNGKLEHILKTVHTYEFIKTEMNNICIGGTYEIANRSYFKGAISEIAFYSRALTADEIADDYNEIDKKTDGLTAYWVANKHGGFDDVTGHGFEVEKQPAVTFDSLWIKSLPEPEYDYTLAVFGDIQEVVDNYTEHLYKVYDWLIANKDSKKIAFTAFLGDFTDWDSDREWSAASEQLHRLKGIMPFSAVPGNHDYETSIAYRSCKMMNKYIPLEMFENNGCFMGAEKQGAVENTYHCFEVCGIKYLLLALEMGPRSHVLEWADGIIEAHPHHNVIITTHSYLEYDGNRTRDWYAGSANSGHYYDFIDTAVSGEEMWHEHLSKHKNVVLVLSGHDGYQDMVYNEAYGVHGNKVVEILCNPQNVDCIARPAGMVALFHFSNSGKTVTVRYYSTVRGEYFREENQFSFDINVIE